MPAVLSVDYSMINESVAKVFRIWIIIKLELTLEVETPKGFIS